MSKKRNKKFMARKKKQADSNAKHGSFMKSLGKMYK